MSCSPGNITLKKTIVSRSFYIILLLTLLLISPADSQINAKQIPTGPDSWIGFRVAMRSSFNTTSDAAPDSSSAAKDFRIDSIRLCINSQINRLVFVEMNIEHNSEYDMRVLDGAAKIQFSPLFNVWLGHFLPPADRYNLSGPYLQGTWDFPVVINNPSGFAGRDNGAAVWGQVKEGAFKWQIGAFEGRNGGSNRHDDLLYSGRLTLNLLEPEPGYYNSNSYFGAKDVIALGVGAMYQRNGAGTDISPGDYSSLNVDLLIEKKFSAGVLDIEGAAFRYDTGDRADITLNQGDSRIALLSWLFPPRYGPGRIQPSLRYQKLESDFNFDIERFESGINYVIDNHRCLVSAVYAHENRCGGVDTDIFRMGLQLQL